MDIAADEKKSGRRGVDQSVHCIERGIAVPDADKGDGLAAHHLVLFPLRFLL